MSPEKLLERERKLFDDAGPMRREALQQTSALKAHMHRGHV